MKRILLFALFAVFIPLRGAETECSGNPCMTPVPTSETAVITTSVRIGQLHLTNTTAGALTVIIKDRSTNCGGSACEIWPTVSIAANTVYVAELHVPAASGFTWQASGSGVQGWISWGRL